MKAYYEKDYVSEAVRTHPYKDSDYGTIEHYYDFKEKPELIPEVLEDFRDWNDQEAIQLFYELLRWLNGESSAFESNDCAFTPPYANQSKQFPKKLECKGRLMIFYRNLRLNIS